MASQPSDRRLQAEQLLREHRYEEAAASFAEHLGTHPDDARALLELGICHLLNRSESEFLAVHARAERKLRAAKELPSELARLWSYYRSLVAKLGAAALAASAVAGCETSPVQSPDVQADTATAAAAASETAAATTAEPAATGAAVAAPPGTTAGAPATTPPAVTPPAATPTATTPTAPTATSTAQFAPPPPTTTTTTPAHRYSGGVYKPPTTPAHRYSGGVRN
jgi:hypothetical protein